MLGAYVIGLSSYHGIYMGENISVRGLSEELIKPVLNSP